MVYVSTNGERLLQPSIQRNRISSAILQPPFFDFTADAAVNYGGIGGVIGHEISHGFDDSGADYDAYGNLVNWWTDKDLEEFNSLGEKLADQYSAIEVLPDTFINGKFTLGENIGDAEEFTLHFDALALHHEDHGKPEAIDGFSAEERFFLSWGTIWRAKIRDEALKNQVRTKPALSGLQPRNPAFKNMDAFYTTFNVQEGDGMYLPEAERLHLKRIAFEQKPRNRPVFLFSLYGCLASIINQLIQSWNGSFTLIVGGGLFLLVQSRGYALQHVGNGWRLLFQKENTQGISRFEALSAVLASTVGLGNISGVAIAIYMGGPGVLLWMRGFTAALGTVIKFYSSSFSGHVARRRRW